MDRLQLPAGGRDHLVLVRGPEPATTVDPPLILLLHGSGGDPRAALEMSGILDVAPSAGFVVAAPQAPTPVRTGDDRPVGGWSWAVPGVPHLDGTPATNRDDVRMILDLADAVSDRFDTSGGVYLVGFSGGARMASAVALAAPHRVAGLGAVSGLRAGRAGGPGLRAPATAGHRADRPVPVIAFHGTEDPVNPVSGDGLPRWGYSVEDAARTWASRNGLSPLADTSRVARHVVRHRYGAGTPGEVQLHLVEGGGHTWPGGAAGDPRLGTPTREVSASALIVTFFGAIARLRTSTD